MDAPTLLVLAAAVHLGFQVTVTVLVYPQLADVPPADWRRVHDAHGRRITPVVVLVYAVVLAAGGWSVTTGVPDTATVVALGALAGALGLTAAAAAPLHGRLSEHEPSLVRRLLAVDRARTALAAVALLAAVVAAVAAS